VLLVLGGRRLHQQLAAHAEVADDRVAGVEREPEVLAAAGHVEDRAAGQHGDEMRVAGQMAADRAGVVHLDGRDGPAGHPLGQALPDGLDLGQLGHGVSSYKV
jgi:hypothetical protein